MMKKIFVVWMVIHILLFTQIQAESICELSDCRPHTLNPCVINDCDRFWIGAEYLYWKIKDSPEPIPLVYKAPTEVPAPVLGSPGTEVVLGGKKIQNKWRSGGRFALGYWFDNADGLGAELNYFFLPEASKRQTVSSNGSLNSTLLSIPFFNVVTAQESSTGLARPGLFSGTATLKLSNKMQGAELNVLGILPCVCGMNVTAIGGFRFWNFKEHLAFDTSSPFVIPPIDIFRTKDRFNVENNFYGGQLGLLLAGDYCDFFISVKGKLALGVMCSKVNINGHLKTNDFDAGGVVQTFPGGYFALPTNIGRHARTKFAVIPELNLNLGYQVCDFLTFEVGYTCLYVNEVFFAGKQIDPDINPTQSPAFTGNVPAVLVGKAAPRGNPKSESLWVQGFNVGFGFQF